MSPLPKKKHISKAEINELPMKSYDGPIHLFNTPDEADAAAGKLLTEKLLGFDTETRPAFRKGESYDPSLLQLATETDVYLFQIMAFAHFKVVGVVGWCDLYESGSELLVYIIVSKNRYLPVHEGEFDHFAHKVCVAFIFRVYCDPCVAQHCFGAGCGYHYKFIAPGYGIFYVPEMAFEILAFGLYV